MLQYRKENNVVRNFYMMDSVGNDFLIHYYDIQGRYKIVHPFNTFIKIAIIRFLNNNEKAFFSMNDRIKLYDNTNHYLCDIYFERYEDDNNNFFMTWENDILRNGEWISEDINSIKYATHEMLKNIELTKDYTVGMDKYEIQQLRKGM